MKRTGFHHRARAAVPGYGISVQHLNNSHFPTHAGCNLPFSGSHSTSSKREVMRYMYHGGEDPPISASQREEDIMLLWGADILTWKQEAAVELSKQAGGGQGPRPHLSPQISQSHSFLDLTTQATFKQTEGNHTAHTLPNCCGSTEDMSNQSSFWSSCETQSSGTWLLFLLLTTALLSSCLCITLPAKQAERSCLPLETLGK